MKLEVLTADGSTPTLGRFLLLECETLSAIADCNTFSPHFALLTAFDLSDVSDEGLSRIANELVGRGLAYVCCWGEDCERWHDAIDVARITSFGDEDDFVADGPHDVLMTTWHDAEPLEEALFFFGRFALPTPKYAVECWDYVIAASPNYTDVIRNTLCRL